MKFKSSQSARAYHMFQFEIFESPLHSTLSPSPPFQHTHTQFWKWLKHWTATQRMKRERENTWSMRCVDSQMCWGKKRSFCLSSHFALLSHLPLLQQCLLGPEIRIRDRLNSAACSSRVLERGKERERCCFFRDVFCIIVCLFWLSRSSPSHVWSRTNSRGGYITIGCISNSRDIIARSIPYYSTTATFAIFERFYLLVSYLWLSCCT